MFQAPGIQPARATKVSANPVASSRRSASIGEPALRSTSRIPLREVGSRQNFVDKQGKPLLEPNEIMKPSIKRISVVSNPQICSVYETEILNTLRESEVELWPASKIFENQTNLTPKMRATLIDWLVDVQKRQKMHTDTLFYAVNYIDRYLMERDIDKSKFQLLGTAAIFLAAKTEEVQLPKCSSLVHLAGDSFSINALCRMESSLFTTLDYDTTPIVSSHFLKRYLLAAQGSSTFCMFTQYINETLLLDSEFICEKPSKVAAGALLFSMKVFKGAPEWTAEVQKEVGYMQSDLRTIVGKVHLSVLATATSRFQAIRKKYASAENEMVSTIEIPKELYL
jgi:cyclin A